MPSPLRGCVISITGDFGAKRTAADLKRWVEYNGAQFSGGVSARVTHLVCSRAAWDTQNPLVKAASKQPSTQIVSYDWLEDSLLDAQKKSAAAYAWSNLEKKRKEKVQRVKEDTQKYVSAKQPIKNFLTGCAYAEQDLFSNNYHVYQDETTFAYHIILTRPDARGTNVDKIALRLYETNTKRPSQYAVVAVYDKHEPSRVKPSTLILAPVGSTFHTAFAAFRQFFQKVTGVEWDFRSWNNAIPLNMPSKAALRSEGWRVEALAADHMERVHQASSAFLDGDLGNGDPLTTEPPINDPERQLFQLLTPPSSMASPGESYASAVLASSVQVAEGPTSAKETCYQYKLPLPSQGQPRGTENMAGKGREWYGDTRTNEQRIGGVSRVLAQPYQY